MRAKWSVGSGIHTIDFYVYTAHRSGQYSPIFESIIWILMQHVGPGDYLVSTVSFNKNKAVNVPLLSKLLLPDDSTNVVPAKKVRHSGALGIWF